LTLPFNKIEFASIADYSPRGNSKMEVISRQMKNHVKHGKPTIGGIVAHIDPDFFREFVSDVAVLVPIPRSVPLIKVDSVWPSKIIAREMLARGLGGTYSEGLERTRIAQKSSLRYTSEERPLVHEHLLTLRANKELIEPTHITLIDDVVTLGRTAFASAIAIHSIYPNAQIRLFALVNTRGLSGHQVQKLINPRIGTITCFESGKTYIQDCTPNNE
jgi:predicted amidophosphoribosyltransferase